MTVREALSGAVEQFEAAGLDDSRLDARLLLEHSLDRSTVWIYQHPETPLPTEANARFDSLIRRRLMGMPIAYLLGSREFYGRVFQVDARVLVPRPETEVLLEAALEYARETRVATVVDVGTGSGILAITLALEIPTCRVWAVDRSADALAVAGLNVDRHGVADRVNLLLGDLLTPVSLPADVIVANLPYVPTAEVDQLQREVRQEPRGALDGGSDGLDLYRRLLTEVPRVLSPRGALFFEIGDQQGAAARLIVQAVLPGHRVRVLRDLADRDRVISAIAERE